MYEVRSEMDQREAYRWGYLGGSLARNGYLPVSTYTLRSLTDFPAGSYSQQYAAGYYDGYHRLPNFCVVTDQKGN